MSRMARFIWHLCAGRQLSGCFWPSASLTICSPADSPCDSFHILVNPRKPRETPRQRARPLSWTNTPDLFSRHWTNCGRHQQNAGFMSGLNEDLGALADRPVLGQLLHSHIHDELARLAVSLAAKSRHFTGISLRRLRSGTSPLPVGPLSGPPSRFRPPRRIPRFHSWQRVAAPTLPGTTTPPGSRSRRVTKPS